MRVSAASVDRIDVAGRTGLRLRLVDDGGRVGWGEASPLPGYSPDDLAAAVAALDGLPRDLDDADADDPRGAVVRAIQSRRLLLDRSASARFALETALLDLIAQRRGLSIAECLGGPRPYCEVDRNALVRANSGRDRVLEDVRRLRERGIRALKVKVSARASEKVAEERRVLEALRCELGASFDLRVDANGAWSLEEARARLDELAALDLRFVEQPTAPELLGDLGVCGTAWAADESLCVAGMSELLLGAAGCAAFVLKPQVLGLLGAYDLGRRAQARGLDVVVTHLFDGRIGMAAACELALGLPRPPLASGLDPHEPGMAPIPQLAVPGRVTDSGRAGLGLLGSDAP